MQDAAGMYTYSQAIAAGKVLGELNYTWFEEPIPDRNLFLLRELTEQLDVPILAGETSRVHELAEGMRMGAFDIARGDVLMKEGITGLRKAVGMADLLGYELEIHGINQPMLELANLHVALSMTNGKWSETFHPIYYRGLKDTAARHRRRGLQAPATRARSRRRDRLGLDRRQHPEDRAHARGVGRGSARGVEPGSEADDGVLAPGSDGAGRHRDRDEAVVAVDGRRPAILDRLDEVARSGPRSRAGSTARARPRSCSRR